MYQVQRNNRIIEQLQLIDKKRDVTCTLDVDINLDRVGAKISHANELVQMAYSAAKKDPENPALYDACAEATLALITAVFGEDGCKQIVDFYEGPESWLEMLVGLFEFINNVIIPQVNEASAERKKQLLEMQKALR